MKAVVLEGERSVSVSDVPDATLPGPDGAVVKVEKTGICGSDLHLYHLTMGGQGVRLGHEFIGTITDVGADVHTVRAGDRVLVSGVIGCGRCVACLARDPSVCRKGGTRVFGTTLDLPGGQAEAVGVPAADSAMLKIPEKVTDEQAVLLTDILPTGFLGARMADIKPGASVVVIGCGPVGLMALRCVSLFGAGRVLAVDMVPERRARAEALGAEPVDPADGGTPAQIMARTNGWGAEAVIEAVGADQTILDAIMCAAPGATVAVIGANMNLALPIPMALLFFKRLTLRSTLASVPSTWDALVPLVSSARIQPDEVFTHKMGLSEAAEAYRMFDAREDGVGKVLLDPAR
ncbi:MAG: alcohol dehydrogenase catalytic domain-containing protein [Actinomycetota bacterium]